MSVHMEKNIGQKLVLILILMKVVELILERAQDNVPKSLEQEKLGLNNDPHIATDFTPAKNNREAFKDESRRIDAHGGPTKYQ